MSTLKLQKLSSGVMSHHRKSTEPEMGLTSQSLNINPGEISLSPERSQPESPLTIRNGLKFITQQISMDRQLKHDSEE